KHENVCLGILNGTQIGLNDMNVIGDISFQDKIIIYDNEEQRIGFAPASCNKLPGTRIIATVHLPLFPPSDESSIYTVTSVLTQRELDLHCATYNIPTELRPELPDRNSTIKDNPKGKIGMYTRFIELANYRIPLSIFLLCLLEYYQINLSQLSVIGAAKVSHFEIMCCALGRIPTVDTSVCLLSISWFGGTSVAKDPLPVDEAVDLPCVELLNENYTFIRKYSETFLCLVGLSRSFVKNDVRPTLLHDNDEEIGLLDFVKSADPFKVKVGEQTLAEDKVTLITETEDRVISHSPQTISLVDHTIQDELNANSGKRKKRVAFVSGEPPVKKARTEGVIISDSRLSTAGKSPTIVRRLIRQGEQAAADSGSTSPATEDATSSSITPTTGHALKDASSFWSLCCFAGASVPAAESAGDGYPLPAPEHETGTLSATPSHDSSADDFYESQTIDSATAMNMYVPNWNVTNNARVNDPIIYRNLLDHVTPPDYWAALRNQGDVGFLDAFNINTA
ncbi:gypsy type transposase, partial [Tanacetum coccineum]